MTQTNGTSPTEAANQEPKTPEPLAGSIGNALPKALKKLSPESLASLRKQRQEDERQRHEEFGRQRIRAALVNAGCPRRHVERDPSDLHGESWHATLDGLTNSLGGGIVALVIGDRGRGKSQLGVELVRHFTRGGEIARYTKLFDLYAEIRSTYGKQSEETERGLLARYRKYPLVVIDAIEQRSNSANEDLLLNHLVDKRYDDGTDTILIGNTTLEAVSEALGTSIVSRANETGGVIVCDWNSYRDA